MHIWGKYFKKFIDGVYNFRTLNHQKEAPFNFQE